jgi:hypothetical protein
MDERVYTKALTLPEMWDEALADVRANMSVFAEARLKWGFRLAKYRRLLASEKRSLVLAEDEVRRALQNDSTVLASDWDWHFRESCSANDVIRERARRIEILAERIEATEHILASLGAKRDAMLLTSDADATKKAEANK